MRIAAAGLNWIRLPIPYAAFSGQLLPGEPFYGGAWPYVLQALTWARRYGLRVKIDLHTAPGGQNAWDHSGRRSGMVGVLRGDMGLANAQRLFNVLRQLVNFVAQPQYSNVVWCVGSGRSHGLIRAASSVC